MYKNSLGANIVTSLWDSCCDVLKIVLIFCFIGANVENGRDDNSGYQPDTTSYDYDAPLTENGDYTMKYILVKDLLKKYNKILTRSVEYKFVVS